MTNQRPTPIFHVTATSPSGRILAHVTVTVTETRAIVFSYAICPVCNRRVMAIPGSVRLEVVAVASNQARSGRGRVVTCGGKHRGCGTMCEVIEHP